MNIRGRVAFAAAAVAVVAIPSMAMAGDSHQDKTSAAKHAIQGGTARNVILLIGDGMGDSEITIARNYQVGAAGRLAMDTLPLTGAYTTYAVQKANPALPEYVTDSAASGTGWATGHKTYNGAISVLPDGKPVPTVLELAKKAGYRTGDVTTAELQDATPAVLGSHVVDRGCKGPQSMTACAVNDKVNGGAGSIAEQLVQTRPDVLLGGGKVFFDQTVQAGSFQGKTVTDQAKAAGYQVVTDAAGLAGASHKAPILGAFAPNNMDVEWVGPTPTRTGTTPVRCATNTARTATQPHLVDMTTKALDVLDKQTKHSKKGFFLQVEGASIDKQDHAANPCGQIGETVAFDAAIKKALDYQKSHRDTLVVVTADHGHTSQIVEAATLGYTATLITHDNANMTISYATAEITGSQQHTGTEVRIAAGGPQAANVLGVTNQTDLFYTMKRALGIR
ncbi:alkaline phosphatase [Actinoplanes awajinensis]|uniref:Alkaline phosphatase n=1 Tax=Actinoplanes awajinensis subsp. mycoplanecinus TaxID=135947 RepID=A0A117MRF5_9ACTN|nr:alkaline phosphatase [Actinoplanes awajinensis]KUL31732.1 alkaline phosphatase [Actinoplanes awajinensis subsp. mycoplanecinus]